MDRVGLAGLRRLALGLLVAFAAGACGASEGSYFAPTAAVVNGQKIPESELAKELGPVVRNPELRSRFEGAEGGRARRLAQREVLSLLVAMVALTQRADGLGISVSPAEVRERIDQVVRADYRSNKEFEATLELLGLTPADVRRNLRRTLLIQKVVAHATKGVEVTAEEVARSYDQNRDTYDQTLRGSHILICARFNLADRICEHTPEDEATARSVTERAQAGEDFGRLAGEFSLDVENKDEGGDLGWARPGALPPELEQALAALSPGQITGPVRTVHGFHVIKLAARGRPLEDARGEIEETLLTARHERAFAGFLRRVLGEARIRIHPKFGQFDLSSLKIVPVRPEPPAGPRESGDGAP
ncbi:MAG: peptidylprolyl isomerase [Actinomycetota bacterium]